jgi:hypothetical protein
MQSALKLPIFYAAQFKKNKSIFLRVFFSIFVLSLASDQDHKSAAFPKNPYKSYNPPMPVESWQCAVDLPLKWSIR